MKGVRLRFHHGLWGSLMSAGYGAWRSEGRLLAPFSCEGGMLARETPPGGAKALGVLSRWPVPRSWLTLTASAVRARDRGGLHLVLFAELRDLELGAVRSVGPVPLAEGGAFALGAVRPDTAVPLVEGSDFVLVADRVEAAPIPLDPLHNLSEGNNTC